MSKVNIVAIIKSKLPTELKLKLEETREGQWAVTDLRDRIRKLQYNPDNSNPR